MTGTELRAWMTELIRKVVSKLPVEDSSVEIKSKWTDPARAARRLGGHANAARREPILWIVGLDEKAGCVSGAERIELPDWWAKVRGSFDEAHCPKLLLDLAVDHGDKVVVGLLFDTTDPPYVVRNSTGSGGIDREVPWREATRVGSASRSQLVSILGSRRGILSADLNNAFLSVFSDRRSIGPDQQEFLGLRLHIEAFIYWTGERPLVIPKHRIRLEGLDTLQVVAEHVRFHGKQDWAIAHRDHEMVVPASGKAYWSHEVHTNLAVTERPASVKVDAVLHTDDPDYLLRFSLSFERSGGSNYKLVL